MRAFFNAVRIMFCVQCLHFPFRLYASDWYVLRNYSFYVHVHDLNGTVCLYDLCAYFFFFFFNIHLVLFCCEWQAACIISISSDSLKHTSMLVHSSLILSFFLYYYFVYAYFWLWLQSRFMFDCFLLCGISFATDTSRYELWLSWFIFCFNLNNKRRKRKPA